jgi:hypothetical protein
MESIDELFSIKQTDEYSLPQRFLVLK